MSAGGRSPADDDRREREALHLTIAASSGASLSAIFALKGAPAEAAGCYRAVS